MGNAILRGFTDASIWAVLIPLSVVFGVLALVGGACVITAGICAIGCRKLRGALEA